MKLIPNCRPLDQMIQQDIATLEYLLRSQLPDKFKRFLFKVAGTYPTPARFTVQDKRYKEDAGFKSDPQILGFAGREDRPYFLELFGLWINELPEGFIPFGHTDFDEEVCYVLDGEEAGSVWLHDPRSDNEETDVFKCADTLEDFLASFYSTSQGDPTPEELEEKKYSRYVAEESHGSCNDPDYVHAQLKRLDEQEARKGENRRYPYKIVDGKIQPYAKINNIGLLPLNRLTNNEIVQDIQQLEKAMNRQFSADLKGFLFKIAGTSPDPGYAFIKLPVCPEGFDVDGFFGGYDESFLEVYEGYKNRVPEEFVTFGFTGEGDAICYLLDGKEAGSVWLWAHEYESAKAFSDRSNCYKIADSVHSFFNFSELAFDDEEEKELYYYGMLFGKLKRYTYHLEKKGRKSDDEIRLERRYHRLNPHPYFASGKPKRKR